MIMYFFATLCNNFWGREVAIYTLGHTYHHGIISNFQIKNAEQQVLVQVSYESIPSDMEFVDPYYDKAWYLVCSFCLLQFRVINI